LALFWIGRPCTYPVLLISLQTMQFCLRTGFGESKEFYGGSLIDLTFGFGQDNGAAPPAFLCLDSLIVNAYKRMSKCAKMTLVYTCRMFLLAAIMYVDDTDLLHLAPSQQTTDEELISQVEESADAWGQLAQATGGALKQPKDFTYFMSYKFTGGKACLKWIKDFPTPQSLIGPDSTGGKVHLFIFQSLSQMDLGYLFRP